MILFSTCIIKSFLVKTLIKIFTIGLFVFFVFAKNAIFSFPVLLYHGVTKNNYP
jgi:hypothetical protein